MEYIVFRKVKEPYGWLGNMSPHPVIGPDSKEYRTAEALFQALRFDDPDICEEIRNQTAPMSAKMVAKKYKDRMVVEPTSHDDCSNMFAVLMIKTAQNPDIKRQLLELPDNCVIVEDCSARPRGNALFWGAKWDGSNWIGKNKMGQIWHTVKIVVDNHPRTG